MSQDERLVEVYRRENNWQKELFTGGQTIHLDQLDRLVSYNVSFDEIKALAKRTQSLKSHQPLTHVRQPGGAPPG